MTVAEAGAASEPGVLGWLKRQVPTRESIERSRWLRPVAGRVLTPALWRFNHRSVPRGVALGSFVAVLFPFAHMPLAAVLALTFRANVPVAVSTTLINNPLTWVPMFGAALKIGRWVLGMGHHAPAIDTGPHESWTHLLAQGSAATAIGLLVIATVLAVSGYLLTSLLWRLRIARRWRKRRNRQGN